MSYKTFWSIVVSLSLLLLLFQNTQVVTFKFFFLKFSMSLILFAILFLAVGVLVGSLWGKKLR